MVKAILSAVDSHSRIGGLSIEAHSQMFVSFSFSSPVDISTQIPRNCWPVVRISLLGDEFLTTAYPLFESHRSLVDYVEVIVSFITV